MFHETDHLRHRRLYVSRKTNVTNFLNSFEQELNVKVLLTYTFMGTIKMFEEKFKKSLTHEIVLPLVRQSCLQHDSDSLAVHLLWSERTND